MSTNQSNNLDNNLVSNYNENADNNSIYIIDLNKYSISNNNTNATSTTKGINQALIDAKTAGYKRVKLPEGHYAIDTSVENDIVISDGINTWTHHRQGITMQSDMELILGCSILEMIPCEDPYYSILTISNCNNSKITGGTILGDRETHDYGMRINENGNMFQSGDFDNTTGKPIADNTKVRTKDFISVYKDWFTKKEETLPNKFYIIPLWNTRRQGISFVATGENYLVQNCNIGKINGVDPQCGIDFEHYNYMENTTIDGCNFYDNKKWDIINYNGTNIEIKNSNFAGGIATTYGNTMDIHNNKFEYRDTEKMIKFIMVA